MMAGERGVLSIIGHPFTSTKRFVQYKVPRVLMGSTSEWSIDLRLPTTMVELGHNFSTPSFPRGNFYWVPVSLVLPEVR